jgi:hypothetical protein
MKSDSDINEQSLILRNANVPTGEIDGEMVALDLDKGECFGIGKIGTVIWDMAEHPARVDEIIDRLVALYDVERGQCLADALSFLKEMNGAGLVRVLPG